MRAAAVALLFVAAACGSPGSSGSAPKATRWDGANQTVVPPVGDVIGIGCSVEGRGGYFYLSDIRLLAGSVARNLAARCVDNTYGLTAVFENSDAAIGPDALPSG